MRGVGQHILLRQNVQPFDITWERHSGRHTADETNFMRGNF